MTLDWLPRLWYIVPMWIERLVKRPQGFLASLMLVGVAILLAHWMVVGCNLYLFSDDDLTDGSNLFPQTFIPTSVAPYTLPHLEWASYLALPKHEFPPSLSWIALVRLTRSPPSAIC